MLGKREGFSEGNAQARPTIWRPGVGPEFRAVAKPKTSALNSELIKEAKVVKS